MTLSELQAKREALVSRMADSVKRVTFGERSTEYGTVDEMQKALQVLDTEIATASGSTRGRMVLIQHSNG